MTTQAGEDLRRVLDHGVVIAGDVEVKLLGLKVLPIKVRLLVGSTTLAESLGVSWWPRTGRRKAHDGPPAPPSRKSNRSAASRGRHPSNGREPSA